MINHLKDVLEIAAAVLVSLGGGSGIVFGLSNYIGKRWADRALERQKQEYVQLNLQLQNQLEATSRRLQAELDALTLIHKLRTQEEFTRLAELWKRIAILREYFEAIASTGGTLAFSDPEMQKQHLEQMRTRFNESLASAQEYLSQEMLFIPQHIVDLANQAMKEATREVFNYVGYQPYLGTNSNIAMQYRECASQCLAAFKKLCEELEQRMRKQIGSSQSPVLIAEAAKS